MLTTHFSEDELNHTDHAIVNVCPPDLIHNARRLAEDVLEPLRSLVGPLRVNSWYRGVALNKAVGGEPTSAHLEGRAADVVPVGGDINVAFRLLVTSKIPYDKAILERRGTAWWIHVQVAKDGSKPRLQAYTSHPVNGRMIYEAYHA